MNSRRVPRPTGVQRCWLPLIQRVQQEAPSGGLAVVTVSVIVDNNGCPLAWGAPKSARIEPASRANAVQRCVMDMDDDGAAELVDHLSSVT